MRLNSRLYWIVPIRQTFHAAEAAPQSMQISSENAVVQDRSGDKKSRQTKKLERILIATVRQLLRTSL